MNAGRYLLAVIGAITSGLVLAQGAKQLHPNFPVVEGPYQMTKAWAVVLPQPFNRRIENDQLVLWRPGHTIWVAAWGNDKKLSPIEQLKSLKKDISRNAFDIEEESDKTVARLGYRLVEKRGAATVHTHYSFTAGPSGYIQMAQYFDHDKDLSAAKKIWRSISGGREP